MLKRVRWIGAGMAIGAGGSVWAQRKLKDLASRYSPSGLAGGAANRARQFPSDIRDALREGRQAMRDREAELRSGPNEPEPPNSPNHPSNPGGRHHLRPYPNKHLPSKP